MRDYITPLGGFLVIGCVVYLASRVRFWHARADYWFTRAMLAEGDRLTVQMRWAESDRRLAAHRSAR